MIAPRGVLSVAIQHYNRAMGTKRRISRARALAERGRELQRRGEELGKRADAAFVRATKAMQAFPGDFRKRGASFLRTELETALMLVALAEKADRKDKRDRIVLQARKAYDALLRFRFRVELTKDEAGEIDPGMRKLKSALQQLGEHV